MKTRTITLLTLVTLPVWLAMGTPQPSASGQGNLPEGATAHRDLADVSGGHVRQKLDLYVPGAGHGAVLLLNNTPDPTGLIPAPDAARSAEFGQEIRRRFGTAVIDTAGSGSNVPMMLSAPRRIGATMIMEDITRGERIRE